MTKTKRTIVTSALPYVNNVPHLGNTVCVISADVYTRFLKSKKEDVIYVCGTDEHGTTTEVKALEEGVSPRQLVDKYFKIHKGIYEWFNCEFDCFGRTSSEENKDVSIDIFEKLDKNGYISENTLQQPFCKKCDKFLSDRFVGGTCPHCDYEDARGDQCESCGQLLNATELKNPKCKVCGSNPEIKETTHLFINLPKIEPKLTSWIKSVESKWSDNAKTMTQAWLREGLKERCITRDLKWGIPVPKEGYKNKVFYSWFDAPIGYIGITKEGHDDWQDLWHSPDKTKLVQFMGKDNIPFHTILFPSFLIGTDDNYTLLTDLNVNEYLNYETGKFSKSRGEGVFGDDAQASGIKADAFRYYIMMNRPESSDTTFTWDDFQSKINNELVANLANLVNRTIVFINKFFDGKLPEGQADMAFIDALLPDYEVIGELMSKIQLKEALKSVMAISKKANQYFQEKEPWKTKDPIAMITLANVVKDLAILIEPFLPKTAESMFKQLNISAQKWGDLGKIEIEQKHQIGKQEHLFSKLEDKQIQELKDKFKGKSSKLVMDLKVAKILSVKNHPEADKLLVLQIDLGSEKRQIVAGIKNYYSKEDLVGRNIVVVTNLEPVKLRGVESNGMLLAADDKSNVVLVSALKSKPGSQVSEGNEVNHDSIDYDTFSKIKLTIKKKKLLADGVILKTDFEEISCEACDGSKVK
jgi:methionyl-tRNA synthetase